MATRRKVLLARARVAIACVITIGGGFSGRAHGAPGSWQSVEPMPRPRAYHAAAAVGDLWFVAGGISADSTAPSYPTEVDVYDPAAGHWSGAGQTTNPREYVIAIPNAAHTRALLVGGTTPGGPSFLYFAESDLVMGASVSSIADLLHARSYHAGAFAGGKYIVSGGWGWIDGTMTEVQFDDAEILDDPPSSWRSGGTMPGGPRSFHTMTTLANGRDVIVAGGAVSDHAFVQVARFDAVCGDWSVVASMNIPRARHAAVALKDGRVLVAGALSFPPVRVERSAELYDPAADRWAMAAPMEDSRYDHAMVLLPDGRVLVAGGTNDPGHGESGALASAELYDPVADAWTPLPPMRDRRRWPTLAVLADGVYVAGGSNASGTSSSDVTILASVERLSWSDLGISVADPSADGGADGSAPTDGPAADAPPSCGSMEKPDASRDGRVDLVAQDGAPNDGTGGGGCSCEAQPGTPSTAGLIIVSLAIGCVRVARGAKRAARRPV